jgi:hypothetical protein
MAMLVVITERGGRAAAPDVSVDATTAHRLAAIGVTNLAVVADDTTQAVVLEGWAFDADADGAAAASILVGDRNRRALRPVLQTLLTLPTDPSSNKGDPA